MRQRVQKTVLFLCTGNYYRSRFAEILFNSVAGKMGLAWRATSRGLALERGAGNVGPMAVAAVEALEALGVRAAQECTRVPAQVTAADFEAAALVIALKRDEHLPLLQERFPSWAEKTEHWDVTDEIGVLPLIEREVMDLVARLLGGKREAVREEAAPEKVASPRVTATVRVGRETKGRRGKGVTTVSDLPLAGEELLALAARLKQLCGTGGTVKDGRVEVQGDHRDRVAVELERLGYRVKRVGG
jgi:predicted translation initiation factor SUI1